MSKSYGFLIEQVCARKSKRDWDKLPSSFEADQVKQLRHQCIEHLKCLDSVGTIKLRIKLSKATRFNELLTILGAEDK